MEGEFRLEERRPAYAPRRSSMAFIIEALVLLLFLIASLAIITQLLTLSANKANESKRLEQAVIIAANAAERFSADPTSVEETSMENGLAVTCSVNETALAYGTQYDALIAVYDENGELYHLQTTRYVPTQYEKQTTRITEGNAGGQTAGNTDTTTSGTTSGNTEVIE